MLQQCLKGELHDDAFPRYSMLVTGVEIHELLPGNVQQMRKHLKSTAEKACVLLFTADRFCLTPFRHVRANLNPCSFRSSDLLLQPAGV